MYSRSEVFVCTFPAKGGKYKGQSQSARDVQVACLIELVRRL
jgi:hypothetical protein